MYSTPSISWPSYGVPSGIWTPTEGFVPTSEAAVWSSWPALSPEPAALDAGEHGVPNDGMSDASEKLASVIEAALTMPGGASLRVPRGLYRFDSEFEVIVSGVDDLGNRIAGASFPITYAEAKALGFKVPADAPPHERPRGPYECKRAAFLSSWTSEDDDEGIAGDGMTDDSDAFGLLLLKAAEAHPSFALAFPRAMFRFETDIEVWIPPPGTSAQPVLDGPSFAFGDRIPVREPAVSDEVFWITLP